MKPSTKMSQMSQFQNRPTSNTADGRSWLSTRNPWYALAAASVRHFCAVIILGPCFEQACEDYYSVVSLFPADSGGVRVVAYQPSTCNFAQLLLHAHKLESLHVAPAPADHALWKAWSKQLIERLEITKHGGLTVGRQPLQANGLVPNFSLTGLHKPSVRPSPSGARPSPAHVTMWCATRTFALNPRRFDRM